MLPWQLFERLRALRLKIAGEQKVPPYIVFTDKTLTDMCIKSRSYAGRDVKCPGSERRSIRSMESGFWKNCRKSSKIICNCSEPSKIS